jgi:hypothetical protein
MVWVMNEEKGDERRGGGGGEGVCYGEIAAYAVETVFLIYEKIYEVNRI